MIIDVILWFKYVEKPKLLVGVIISIYIFWETTNLWIALFGGCVSFLLYPKLIYFLRLKVKFIDTLFFKIEYKYFERRLKIIEKKIDTEQNEKEWDRRSINSKYEFCKLRYKNNELSRELVKNGIYDSMWQFFIRISFSIILFTFLMLLYWNKEFVFSTIISIVFYYQIWKSYRGIGF
jgi:hypothetical protein